MPHDIFVSYSTKDKPTADAVCATLESRGIRCWIAPRDILPGVDWGEALIEAIEGSRIMVLVFSQNANDSPQIKREVERAVNKGVAVVPVRIENVPMSKSLEYFVSTPHWLDAMTPPLEQHLNQLADTLKLLLQRVNQRKALGEEHPETEAAPNPRVSQPTSPEQQPRAGADEAFRAKPPPISAPAQQPQGNVVSPNVRPPPVPPPFQMPPRTLGQWLNDPRNRPAVIVGAVLILFVFSCLFFSCLAQIH